MKIHLGQLMSIGFLPSESKDNTLHTPKTAVSGWFLFRLHRLIMYGQKFDIGFWAITLAAGLMLCRAADGKAAMAAVPWSIIMMVCGASMLINVMTKTGGLELFTGLLAQISNPANVTGMLALVTGIVSSYSSSSGVIMPAFIPIVPGLIEKIGGGDPVALVASINVGSHVVDASPLSTLGALCLAQAARYENKTRLFRQLLVFGLSMSLAGASICYLFFEWFGRYQ